MGAERERLKRMIDNIPDQDVLKIFNFIQELNSKREIEISQQDVHSLTEIPILSSK